MRTPEQRAADAFRGANYQSPYATDPSSTSWRVAHGLSPLLDGSGAVPTAAALAQADAGGATGGSANPQMLARVLRRMGGGQGVSGQGGFNFGQQTAMNGAGGPPGVMGSQGQAQSGPMLQAPWQGMNRQMYPPTPEAGGAGGFAGGGAGGAGGFAGGGGTMWAGGSPTFNEGAGGSFIGGLIGGGGLPGASAGGMSPGMAPRPAGGMSFAPPVAQQQADPWQDFLSQYSQQ